MQLRNDKILILGGSSGIGKAIAKRFCDAGAKVMITGRSVDKLQMAKDEIASPNLYCKVFDVANVDIIGSYGAAKSAIIKWTRSLGKKYGSKGIRHL